MSKLPNVKGRITYISSHAKQENLYAVYETTDRRYWTKLAKCNQEEFEKSGTVGKCIEARELIIALPESFPDLYEPDKLLRLFTDHFKEQYGVECVSALHHNKRKTNYHIHLIFSEREMLPEPIEKIATRNMFYDEQGKHVRTKKEILDENGEIRKGCKIVKKCEVYERNLFTAKNRLFKQEGFLDEVKHFYTNLINALVKDGKEKLHVFNQGGLYLATKKIGKNNPKAQQIQTDNGYRMRWNREVDRALVSGVAETEIRQIKKEYITDRSRESVDVFGNQPERLGTVLMSAVAALAILISKVLQKAVELSGRLTTAEPGPLEILLSGKEAHTLADRELATKLQTPPRPVMPAEAANYPGLDKIYKELQRQNEIIFAAEKERSALEMERNSLKGLAKITPKGGIQSRIDRKNEEIDILKMGLSGIAKKYGYKNVQEFYRIYHKAEEAYAAYQKDMAEWKERYEEGSSKKVRKSIRERLKTPPEQRENYRKPEVRKKDRGAR